MGSAGWKGDGGLNAIENQWFFLVFGGGAAQGDFISRVRPRFLPPYLCIFGIIDKIHPILNLFHLTSLRIPHLLIQMAELRLLADCVEFQSRNIRIQGFDKFDCLLCLHVSLELRKDKQLLEFT